MALGLSFGSSKTKSSTDTTATKNEQVNSTQNQATNQTQTGSTTTNQTGTQNQSTTGATKGSQTSTQQTAGQTNQAQTQTSFSDAILSALEGSALGAIGAANGATVDTTNDFDAAAYVRDGMAAATANQQGALETSLNGLFDSSGGTASGNSMSALLANRLQGDAAASLAGVNSQLSSTAAQIQNQNTQTSLAGAAQTQGYAAQLLAALKGGSTTATGTTDTTQSQTGSQDTISEQNQNQNTTSSSTSQQDSTQSLISIINTLLNQNTASTATGTENTTGKKSGGGASLSL